MPKTLPTIFMFAIFSSYVHTAELTVNVVSKEDVAGKIIAGFYSVDNRENFGKRDAADITCQSNGEIGGATIKLICNLPPGVYAAAFFHDTNDNNKLDSGLLGPKEPYGFSNNAFGLMGKGKPDFNDASFAVKEERVQIDITLK